jgi:hypothetical protein
MDKAQIDALLARIDVWLLVFGVIVVIGVAGESFFGIRHWWNSRKLQTIQSAEEQERQETIARLNNGAANAEQQAQSFQLQIAQANERTARAELELAKLKAPRVLTEEQQRELVAALKPFPNTAISIEFEYADGEAKALAMQLWGVLTKAGWKVGFGSPTAGMPEYAANTLGIVVNRFGELKRGGIPIVQRFADAGAVLSKTLDKMGLLSKYPGIVTVSDKPDESVYMVVGRKPLE